MQKWQPCLPRWPRALGLSGILQPALSAWGLIIGSWCLSITHSCTVWLLSRACKFTSSLMAKAYNASGQAASTSLSRNLLNSSQQWKSRWRLLKTLCLGAGQGPPWSSSPCLLVAEGGPLRRLHGPCKTQVHNGFLVGRRHCQLIHRLLRTH